MNYHLWLGICERVRVLEREVRHLNRQLNRLQAKKTEDGKEKEMKTPKYTAIVFQDRRREWRWSIVSRNKRIVATSGEGYKRKAACVRTLTRLLTAGPTIAIEYFTKPRKP